MARQTGTNRDLLAMALVGYEAEIGKINTAIEEIRARLGTQAASTDGQAPKKRTMSAAARRRIAAAQRKRWAAVRKGKAKATAPKKRKLSAAGRKAMAEAARRRWAAVRKAAGKKAKPGGKAAPKATAEKATGAAAS